MTTAETPSCAILRNKEYLIATDYVVHPVSKANEYMAMVVAADAIFTDMPHRSHFIPDSVC